VLVRRVLGEDPTGFSPPPRKILTPPGSEDGPSGRAWRVMANGRYWLHTLGCPKNQVDSDKLAGLLGAQGFAAASGPDQADLVVVNTCAFIESARQESIEAVLELADAKRAGARLVVTGCMAERYGEELARALPEVDRVAGFGAALGPTPVSIGRTRKPVLAGNPSFHDDPASRDDPAPHDDPASTSVLATDMGGSFDLLELPRPAAGAPWAYVKVAEGCDRRCGFCAIPSFRGPQRSRTPESVLAEVAALADHGPDGATSGVREIVLVAQDLVSYGRDRGQRGAGVGGALAGGRPPAWPIVPPFG
jgi:ribosomal protein S12 methylthiotransferase